MTAKRNTRHGRNHTTVIAAFACCAFLLLVYMIYHAADLYVRQRAENEVEGMLLQHQGVHEYVQRLNHPELYRLKAEGRINEGLFTPVLFSSSFMVRNMHAFYNQARKKHGLPDLYYKMAALNPRNPVNRADTFEAELIRRFDADPSLKEYRAEEVRDGKRFLVVAIPFLRNTPACLRCHGRREDAPLDLQRLYPGEGGFHEKVGALRAIESIRAPLSNDYLPYAALAAAVLVGLGLLGLGAVNWRLRDMVDERTAAIREQAELLRRSEENLRQYQKLEAVGQLAGGIAHDFNNVTAAILGATELLDLSSAGAPPDPEREENLAIIRGAIERARELTNRLLVFSRKRPATLEPVDAHRVIEETLQLLKRTIDPRIDLRARLESGHPTILGDPGQLQSALLNLGINAAHAMPGGGSLVFATADRHVDEAYRRSCAFPLDPGPHLEIEVRDTGTGIPPEHLKRIFDPFFTTKPPGEGTGLGLALVHATMRQWRGAISVYSEIGKGTAFRLLIPQVAEPERVPERTAPPVTGQGRILFVDDEANLRRLGRSTLERLGYSVETAENGAEALARYGGGGAFDLVLLDLSMPVMNGRDCLARLLAADPRARVIVCSGYLTESDEAELLAAGARACLVKPFRTAELSRVVAEALTAAS